MFHVEKSGLFKLAVAYIQRPTESRPRLVQTLVSILLLCSTPMLRFATRLY